MPKPISAKGLAAVMTETLPATVREAAPHYLDNALSQLEAKDPDAARLVNLRFFAGLTLKDAATSLGLAPRTAERQWAYARAWLYARLRPDENQ